MKVHAGVDKDSGLIHSAMVTAGNAHDLTPAGGLLHDDEVVVYGDAGYPGIANKPEMDCMIIDVKMAKRPGKRRVLPDTPEGRLEDLIETAKAYIYLKAEHPFCVIKQQFSSRKVGCVA